MKQSIISTIKNGKISLPKELRREWEEGEVVFMRSQGGFLVKSLTPPSLTVIAKKLSRAATKGGVTTKNVKQAVAWARKKTYESGT